MSAGAVAVKGNFRVRADESSTRASYRTSFEREQRVVATMDVSAFRRRGNVVELTPRTFAQTAEHFLGIAKPVDYSVDEADID